MAQNPIALLSDVKTFFVMMKSIVSGKYPMPWKTFFWVALCTIYFLSPIDLLPDILPILGFADDGAFILFVLLLIHKDLENFRQTKQSQDNIIEAEVIHEDNQK